MSPEPPRPRQTLPILFSVIIIDVVGFGIVVPVLPYLADTYGASSIVLGLLLTVYPAMQFLFSPVWGRLSDRIGRRPVMLITIAGTAASLLALGLANDLFWLFVARTLGGVFAANISVATAYLTDVTAEDERTRWMGMVGASFGIGFILGPAIGGFLSLYGYSFPMLFAAGVSALNFVHALFSLQEPDHHHVEEAGPPASELLRKSALVRQFCVVNFFFVFALSQLESMFALFMLHRFEYDAYQVASILVVMGLVIAGIQGGAIRGLAKRFGERRLLLVGVALMAVAFAAVPFMPTVALLMAPLILSSIGRGVSQPSLMSLVSLASSASSRGTVMGSFQSAASLARATSPLIGGLLFSLDPRWPFLMGAVLMTVACLISTRIPEEPPAPENAVGSDERPPLATA